MAFRHGGGGMVIFYTAVMGDPLDTRGNSQIIEGAQDNTIEGPDGRSRPVALIGHRAWCDACKSVGLIVEAPGSPYHNRMVDFVAGGAREALGGDLVMCKCKSPARIIAVYGRSSMILPDSGPVLETAEARANLAGNPDDYDEHFVLTDLRTGRPLAGFAWGIDTPDGPREGCTGADGKTATICGCDREPITLSWIAQTEMGIRS